MLQGITKYTYDERGEFRVLEQVRRCEVTVGVLDVRLNGDDHNIDGSESEVNHKNDPEDDHCKVELSRALRSITESKDEARDKGDEIEPFEYHSKDTTGGSQ